MPKTSKTTKTTKRVKRTTTKQQTKQGKNKRKYVRKTKTHRRKYRKHTKEQKPFMLYSKDPTTGMETIAKTDMTNKEGVKTYFASVESKLPPTVYKTNDGSQFMTMNEKRAIVIESFKNNRK